MQFFRQSLRNLIRIAMFAGVSVSASFAQDDQDGVELVNERVGGASLFATAENGASVSFDLVLIPLKQSEIDLFVKHASQVIDWAEDHAPLWMASSVSRLQIRLLRKFEVWEDSELSLEEFLALRAKLKFTRELLAQPISVEDVRSKVHIDQTALAGQTGLSDFERARAERAIEELKMLVDVLENVAPGNAALYEANREEIDPLLDRLLSIGRISR